MAGQEFRYDEAGLTMIGSLHRPSGRDTAPGVLVFPEASGFSDHTIDKAERIANELGYVALACDLWGERRLLTTGEEVLEAVGQLAGNIPLLRRRINTALMTLIDQSGVDGTRIAAIGFCYGGTMAFELATCSDICAAIGFHPGLKVPSLATEANQVKARILALLGADDPVAGPDSRTEFMRLLTDAGVDWQMTLHGGVVHSFTNPEADEPGQPDYLRYDPKAYERSWSQMSSLLREVFA